MKLLTIACTNCGRVYPLDGIPYKCPTCGGVFDIPQPLPYDANLIDSSQPGIWRYRHTFGLPDGAEVVSLGEGNTPLQWAEVMGRQVAFKCEYLNPTGSFKDRGTSVITGYLKSRGVHEVVEDSSGNAGASLSAYTARAGVKARIFVPASASGPKLQQIEFFGAEVVPVQGSRGDVTSAVLKEAEKGIVYASHAYLPFNIPGYATAAYEIIEQIGTVPSAVITPCGQGGLLLGLCARFRCHAPVRQGFSDAEDDRGSSSCVRTDVGFIHSRYGGDGIRYRRPNLGGRCQGEESSERGCVAQGSQIHKRFFCGCG